MMRLQCLIVLTCAIVCIFTATDHLAAVDPLKTEVDRLVNPLIDSQWIVGMSVGVISGDMQATYHYGSVDTTSFTSPTDQTLYEIGSITKTFTGILLAEAARRGEVSLTDPIAKFLPPGITAPSAGRLPITLYHLSTHSSGLPRMPRNFHPADPLDPYADYTPRKLFEGLDDMVLVRQPGEAYEYSNLAVGLLGNILAGAAKQSYESLMIDRIAKPFGMENTSVTLRGQQREHFAKPHNADTTQVKRWRLNALAGAGGIHSNISDMLRYLEANMRPSESPLGQSITRTHQKEFPTGTGSWIGLGWIITRDQVTPTHSGMTGGYASYIAWYPPKDVGVVVLSNTASPHVAVTAEKIIRQMIGIPETPVALPDQITLDIPQYQACEGRYQLAPFAVLEITRHGNQLLAQLTGQSAIRVYPTSPTQFFYKAVDAKLTFEPGENGKMKSVTLHQNGRDMISPRIEN